MNPREDVNQRVECTELRMRLEAIADGLVQEMFDLSEEPVTRLVESRITAIIGRIPNDDVDREHWAIVASAQHAYRQLCDVIHGRTAWTLVPRTQLASWAEAVRRLEAVSRDVGLTAR